MAEAGWEAADMTQDDPNPFQELFASEPTDASVSEAREWVRVYERLIAMMERQLEETRAFANDVHAPMQRYLNRENVTILEEEINAFKQRLTHWNDHGGTQS
jgi:cob(I)alamin adenosyltransferase